MSSPYLIGGPAIISFSGGRTSAYMLRHILDAHGGSLPDDVRAVWMNTGMEHPATLDFVRECSGRWGVPVTWLERDAEGGKGRRFRVVDHATASRDGGPYEALIRERRYLPNPVTRFCTTQLKVRVMRDFARSLGWGHWVNAIGLRYDEPRRVAKMKDRRERCETVAPLHRARVTKEDVAAFWAAQDFDLRLPDVGGRTPHGNCVGCFLKSAKTLSAIFAEDPSAADWWIRMEAAATPNKPSGARFRNDRPSYRQMRDAALARRAFDFGEADALSDCLCHD